MSMYNNCLKDNLFNTIKEMFESGYTISEVLEIVAAATDEFFNNARY